MKSILHIGSGRTWRGGENQVSLLTEGAKNFKHHIAYPRGAKAIETMGNRLPYLILPSSKAYDFRNTRAIRNYCVQNEIDIIDAQSSVALDWAIKVKKYLPKLKLVFHRRVAFPIKTNYFSRRKYFSPSIDAYVGISGYIVQQLLDYGVPKEKVHKVCSAVHRAQEMNAEQESTAWKARLNIPESAKLMGLVGAMTWEKGHDLALEAMSCLEDESIHFLLAGEGSQRIEIENYIEKLGLSSRVHLLGHIQKVPSLISSLDVLVVPSRQEGLGSTVLDAMMHSCLVVASNAGGLPEMVKDGETGFLFESGNAQALAQKLKQAWDVYQKRDIQQRAKEYVESHFSIESMVAGNEKIYQSLF